MLQDPQPPEQWIGVREAYNLGSVCVQKPYDYPLINTTEYGNEDCLYLSVYSPNVSANTKYYESFLRSFVLIGAEDCILSHTLSISVQDQ